MMPAKMATLGLLKIKLFWSEGYGLVIFVCDVTNKILLRDSNYIVDVIMWSNFSNSSISMKENLTRKTNFFEGGSWFKFNDLGLALGMALKFYVCEARELKLKSRKFWGLISTFVEVIGEKLWGGGERRGSFYPPILKRVSNVGELPNS